MRKRRVKTGGKFSLSDSDWHKFTNLRPHRQTRKEMQLRNKNEKKKIGPKKRGRGADTGRRGRMREEPWARERAGPEKDDLDLAREDKGAKHSRKQTTSAREGGLSFGGGEQNGGEEQSKRKMKPRKKVYGAGSKPNQRGEHAGGGSEIC